MTQTNYEYAKSKLDEIENREPESPIPNWNHNPYSAQWVPTLHMRFVISEKLVGENKILQQLWMVDRSTGTWGPDKPDREWRDIPTIVTNIKNRHIFKENDFDYRLG